MYRIAIEVRTIEIVNLHWKCYDSCWNDSIQNERDQNTFASLRRPTFFEIGIQNREKSRIRTQTLIVNLTFWKILMVIIKAVHWIKKIDKQFIGGQIIDNFSVTDDWRQGQLKTDNRKDEKSNLLRILIANLWLETILNCQLKMENNALKLCRCNSWACAPTWHAIHAMWWPLNKKIDFYQQIASDKHKFQSHFIYYVCLIWFESVLVRFQREMFYKPVCHTQYSYVYEYL